MFSDHIFHQSILTQSQREINDFWHDDQEHEVIQPKSQEEYLKIERHRRAIVAAEDEDHRRPDPQGNSKFEQENFFDFKVIQQDKEIHLMTYRSHAKTRKANPKAILIFIHGINGHSGLCAHLAEQFVEHELTSVAFDQRGYGKSEGQRAYIDNIQTTVKDIEILIDVLKNQIYTPNIPIFVLGYSLGGLYTYLLGLKNPEIARGFILFSPSIKENLEFEPLGKFVAQWLTQIAPKWITPVKCGRSNASQNPTVNENIYQDKLIYDQGLRAGTINNVIIATRQAAQSFHLFKAPFLIIMGGLDKICDPDVAFELYEKSPSKDKDFLFYDDMWHDAWHEEELYDYLPRVTQWIEERSHSEI